MVLFKKKIDDDDDDDEEEQTIVRHKTRNTDGSNKDKIDSELLIEPKSEYEDGNDEAVEDLTMADEELMEDLEQAGPSHGGEGSSQGNIFFLTIFLRNISKSVTIRNRAVKIPSATFNLTHFDFFKFRLRSMASGSISG